MKTWLKLAMLHHIYACNPKSDLEHSQRNDLLLDSLAQHV